MANRRAKPKTRLKVIALGGLEEIGKNMTVLEYGNDIVIIDCGLAFPEDAGDRPSDSRYHLFGKKRGKNQRNCVDPWA